MNTEIPHRITETLQKRHLDCNPPWKFLAMRPNSEQYLGNLNSFKISLLCASTEVRGERPSSDAKLEPEVRDCLGQTHTHFPQVFNLFKSHQH